MDNLPPLAALFLIRFDQKVGYTIAWKRSVEGLDLDGVEYQCLPSGLHGVKEDLVYFFHGSHAGVSAFVQGEADESHRHANFMAVGALVPLSYGRLGKSWLHAAGLRRLAHEAVQDADDTKALELYWQQNEHGRKHSARAASPSIGTRMSSPDALRKKVKRVHSDGSHAITGDGLPPDHPAFSMTDMLDTFGPLIFPLFRAALLRKRILLLGTAPVQQSCNFVYLLSVLSNIPQAQFEILQPDTEALSKTQALFSVGIHDIPFLSDKNRTTRWIACTTDDILGEKKDLYDVLAVLRDLTPQGRRGRPRPVIRLSDGTVVKATQRDLRRYRLLRSELERITSISGRYQDDPSSNDEGDHEAVPLIRTPTTHVRQEVKRSERNERDAIEPVSWSALAYNGFMWWASAGEMEAWQNDETRSDRELLDDLPELDDLLPHLGDIEDAEESVGSLAQAIATLVTAYFHRLIAQILQPLAELVETADDGTEQGIAEAPITVSADDVRGMGLDSWSEADKSFVQQMMGTYFGREALVDAEGTRICGVRVC
ncbi:uncharacterized protein LTR77_008108 [Saxophila tyrrhenica]|uniref:DUF4484 domain-containing protein n=1 Tax=Saxophila tyrrhenica TaxID=1690608 RepID=A0AAV9P1T2_9PEZI|nr:hypothetical protein LTR77_008108 [Saxophila tyrrhenica]